jgi:hypothetical protein
VRRVCSVIIPDTGLSRFQLTTLLAGLRSQATLFTGSGWFKGGQGLSKGVYVVPICSLYPLYMLGFYFPIVVSCLV